jgi:membrane protease YdiL (CAAX protease family)
MRYYKKIFVLIIVISASEVIPYGFAKYIADSFQNFTAQTSALSYFLGALVHRSVQFILVLMLLKLLFRAKLSNFGFNFNNKKLSLNIIAYVSVLWPIIILAFFIFSINCINGFSSYLSSKYPSSVSWMIASLSRDALLLDSFAEEILYRSFVILSLERYWKGTVKIKNWSVSHATLLSVPIFVAAHISLTIFPFKVISYDPTQLVLTLFTGLLFAISFEKTRSLFAPIVLHGYTNFIITVAGYLTVFLTSPK